ncbi:MAG: molybdopterin converting factor subunit 1 [Alphaproteobacteria bacterium]|nr:molybdopterin converting factor subunit 1 [Alphaproteobacteria bacterium]
MKIMYFAWMREHTGCAEEQLDLPESITTVADLVEHLRQRSPGHAKTLSNMDVVRVAVNLSYCTLETSITNGDEVAFFPPVTGG